MTNLPAVNGSGVSDYLAKHGSTPAGSYIKFAKDGKYRKTSDDEEVAEDTAMVVVYDQIQGGYIKFMGKGKPPERKMGPLFAGFMPPDRESLGDTDQSEWETDLGGRPSDPWQFQLMVPMQAVESGELYIFTTSSVTGRRAVDSLIQQCARMQKMEPDVYPIVKLGIGGFQHRDERVGWVKTPIFPRIGKAPKSDAAAAVTSVADGLNDAIPW